MKQPCERNCSERAAGCGTTCERWKKYVAARNAEYEERMRRSDFDAAKRIVIDRAERAIWRKRKK